MKLSIVIPTFNEEKTILHTLKEVINADTLGWEKEILVVDDGSSDNTLQIIKDSGLLLNLHVHDTNYGKGKAVQTGILYATGDYVIIQDADLEYSPKEYKKLISKVQRYAHKLTVVYGRRSYRKGYILYRIGGYLLALVTNVFYITNLHDIYTCYKLIPRNLFLSLHLQSDGFEVEAEITTKLLNKRVTVHEVPIEYAPRSFKEGKKIRARDAWKGFKAILFYSDIRSLLQI